MKNKKGLFGLLVVLALTERVGFDLGPNVELVTMAGLLAAAYLGKKQAVGVVLTAMIISDLVLGNTRIFLFTWSGFMIPMVAAGGMFKRWKINRVVSGTIAGVGANLFFYLWTNFGVWALDGWGMYAKDWGGLTQCYINALPFLKLQLVSTLMFVPTAFGVVEGALSGVLGKKENEWARG